MTRSEPTPEHADSDAEIQACYDVMAELRPHIAREQFLPLIRSMEQDGFRLACIKDGARVVAVAGYRVSTNLFYGYNLYVDDLVTADSERSKGRGRVLLAACEVDGIPPPGRVAAHPRACAVADAARRARVSRRAPALLDRRHRIQPCAD